MASPKEDGTWAATDQLRSMALGESVERKEDNETKKTIEWEDYLEDDLWLPQISGEVP